MKVYNVITCGGEYEDRWEESHLFSTIEKAKEFIAEEAEEADDSCFIPETGYTLWEWEVDTNNKIYLGRGTRGKTRECPLKLKPSELEEFNKLKQKLGMIQ